MRRFAASALIPLLAFLALALPVHAAVKWCKADPIVRLDGTEVQILVAIPQTYQPLVNGPIDVEVGTPRSVVRELILLDAGFNGYGETVRFTNLSRSVRINKDFTTEIRVRVPVDGSRLLPGEVVPVEVTIIPDNAPAAVVLGTSEDTSASLLIRGR